MTVATAPRRRPRKCVRCGIWPRHIEPDGYVIDLCAACLAEYRPEAEMALREAPDNPRLWLVSVMGWKGGWPGFHEAADAA